MKRPFASRAEEEEEDMFDVFKGMKETPAKSLKSVKPN